jgi:hypothetical protein
MCFDDKLISHAGTPTERYEAGRTDLSGTEMWWALQEHFRPGSYDLLRKNCNSFSDAALFFLLRKRLNKKYSSLESLGRTSPDMVKRVIYVPNPVAAEFDIQNVIDAVSKLGAKKASQGLAEVRYSVPSQDHRIPHLPRPSIQRKVATSRQALGDITNAQQGPGARANEAEKMQKISSDDSMASSKSSSSRPAPRKFASSQAPRNTASPPRQPLSIPPSIHPGIQADIADQTQQYTPRGVSAPRSNPDRLLTNRVYPTNRKAPGSDKENLNLENLTPRANHASQDVAVDENRRSRSKGPTTRNGAIVRSKLENVLGAVGGA